MMPTRARLIFAIVATGALTGGCSVAVPGRQTVPTAPAGVPQLSASKLDSLLLTDEQISTIVGVAGLETHETYTQMADDRAFDYTVGDPVCVTALWNTMKQSYRASNFSAVTGHMVSEPGDNPDHEVDEGVVLFKTADQAQRHLDQSMLIWQRCAGKRQRYQPQDHNPETWSVGIPTDVGPDIVVRNSKEASDGFVCQHVMRAAGNVLVDGWTCGRDITDQARIMVDDIAAKVQS
jgi:hypothetical protein